jgi:putative phage-type endonuclease
MQQLDPKTLVQGSDEWLNFRLGKVSASRVSDVMAKNKSGPSATRKNYLMELLCQRLTGRREESFTSDAMKRGTAMEPIARSAYEVANGVMVMETGCFVHPDIASFIASPDGLVGTSGLLEIKNPNTAQHVDFIRTGKIDTGYELQMLAQMACTGRQWVDYVSFDDRLCEPLQYRCKRFHFDAARAAKMLTEITAFIAELDALEGEMRGLMAPIQQAA